MTPMAIAIPPRLMMLAGRPISRMTRKLIRMPTGKVKIATREERK